MLHLVIQVGDHMASIFFDEKALPASVERLIPLKEVVQIAIHAHRSILNNVLGTGFSYDVLDKEEFICKLW